MKQDFRRNGFTLLEMSIVIVVIGLLVGGLVGARGYIKNAQLTTLVNESKYYINAFGQFQSQYNAVPGDMGTASSVWIATGAQSAAHNGDGNGVIRAGTGNGMEIFQSFEHLAKAGLIAGHYTGLSSDGTTTSVNARAGLNVPNAAMTGVAYIFNHPDPPNGSVAAGDSLYFSSGAPGNSGLYGHVLQVAGLAATGTGLPSGAFLTPKQAYQLDSKFDDGNPAAGWVMTGNGTALPNCTTAGVSSGAAYTVTNTGMACFLILRIQ